MRDSQPSRMVSFRVPEEIVLAIEDECHRSLEGHPFLTVFDRTAWILQAIREKLKHRARSRKGTRKAPKPAPTNRTAPATGPRPSKCQFCAGLMDGDLCMDCDRWSPTEASETDLFQRHG